MDENDTESRPSLSNSVLVERAHHFTSVCSQEGDAHVHAILGGPEPDVDTVAATLGLALYLSQVTLFCLKCLKNISGIFSIIVIIMRLTELGFPTNSPAT